jgi:hypothetical protein
MAASAPLFIGYAHASVSALQVKDAFENALNEDGIVSKVDFREKTGSRGEPFLCYFVHFAHENRQLEHMRGEIEKNGFVVLTYARDWDKRKWNAATQKYGVHVDRFWKVLAYKEKPKSLLETAKFVPRLMTLAEAQAAGITAPKKKEVVGGAEVPRAEKKEVPRAEKCKKEVKIAPLDTDSLYTPNLSWDSHDAEPAELPPIPPTPPVLRRSPSSAAEYGMVPRPKRRRSFDDVENAFAALNVQDDSESEEEKIAAEENALAGLA